MRAVGLYTYLPVDNPESLLDVEIPRPEAAGRDLLVRVKAVSVNPVDTKVRAPKDKVESAPRVLGWDAAGIVEEVGDQVTLFKPGDEVYYAGSITRPGSNSEYHLVDERITGRKPRTLSFEEAAAMPLTTITAYEALFDRMGISKLLADRGEGRGVREEKTLLINPFQRKSVAFCWELMFTRPMFQTPDMQAQHELLNETAALLEAGTLRTTKTKSFGQMNAENLRKAHAEIERGEMIGKATLSN